MQPTEAVIGDGVDAARERATERGAAAGWALGALLALMTALSHVPVTREATEARLESASARALAAFALARGLNAAISVVQETEVGFSLGVNVSVEPGQALDPLNDLVERFSLVALAAAAVLGALRLLLDLFSWGALQAVLWGWLAVAVVLAFWRGAAGPALRPLAAVVTVWAFVWLTPLAMEWVHRAPPIAHRYAEAQAALEQARTQLGVLRAGGGLPDRETLERWVEQASALATGLSEQLLAQLSAFLLETLAVPLVAFWVAGRMVSALLAA